MQADHSLAPLVVSVGEPAGIGPDICLQLAAQGRLTQLSRPCVFIADPQLLQQRAQWRRIADAKLHIETLPPDHKRPLPTVSAGQLLVHPIALTSECTPGQLNPDNSPCITRGLDLAIEGCRNGQYSALVTAPVHKAAINQGGIPFSGHTEYIAERTGGHPVMMLATEAGEEGLRVALATTHLPLAEVPAAITRTRLDKVINTLHHDLQQRFGIARPRIAICGLNPHAGEDGHLGREEIDTIIPCLEQLRAQGMDLLGPLPADTAFSPANRRHCDAFLAMYHDQGLPVLKTLGFGEAVNITLGLPIVRTSVDHGTALDLAAQAGSDTTISPDSLFMALKTAEAMLPANRP